MVMIRKMALIMIDVNAFESDEDDGHVAVGREIKMIVLGMTPSKCSCSSEFDIQYDC